MIHVNFSPQDLSSELRDDWEQLNVGINDAIQEYIALWEIWKQLKKYDLLRQKDARTRFEEAEMQSLREALQMYILPTGEVDPAHRSSKPGFDFRKRQKVWAGIKHFLLENVFHHKCAYCETQTGQFQYDAEHYRPKGEVTVVPGDGLPHQHVLTEDEDEEELEHPGYFWLVLDWKNLVPSCKSCNGPGGKMTQFPVQRSHILLKRLTPNEAAALDPRPHQSPTWPGMYYLRTEQLDQLEDPLLLHPYMDKENDPRRHIRFGYKGIEYALEGSTKGSHSIKVFRLYKDTLRKERYEVQKKAASLLMGAYRHYLEVEELSPEDSRKKARAVIGEFEKGTVAYSAAALDYVEETWKPFRAD